MKVFESNAIAKTDINGAAMKVLETGKGFLLNCQYYTKELIPVPLESLYIAGNTNYAWTNKHMYLSSTSWRECQRTFGVIGDNKNPEISYNTNISGDTEYFNEFEESNGTIKNIANLPFGAYQFLDKICQDDLYIYFTYTGVVSSYYRTYLARYNKNTKTIENLIDNYCYYTGSTYSYPRYEKVYVDDEKIILFYLHNNYYYFYRYYKSSNTGAASAAMFRGQSSDTTNYQLSVKLTESCVVDLGNDKSGIYAFNTANPAEPIDMYIIDREAFTSSMQHYTITWNSDKTEFSMDPTRTWANRIYMWTATHNGDRYLHVAFYNQNFENASHAPYQGIYSFIIDDVNHNLTFTGYNSFSTTVQFHGLLLNESCQYGLIGFYNQFGIIEFNALTKRYEQIDTIITDTLSVGFDQLERIWYVKTDKSVHMINLKDVQNVTLEFEKKYYEYTGTSINTYITFDALNYLDQPFSGKFQLTINGPAVFVDNNSTTIEINYAGVKQQIDLLITGASPISIYPKFLSV